jgi:hypothetical protein
MCGEKRQELVRPMMLLGTRYGMRILRHVRGNPDTALSQNLSVVLVR